MTVPQDNNRTHPKDPEGLGKSALAIWWQSKSPIFRFLAGFVSLMVLFYTFYYSPFYEQFIMERLLGLQARLANAMLHLAGHNTEAIGDHLVGSDFRVSIKGGCDGLEATALYMSAVMAFPFALAREKWRGLLSGVLLLSLLNLFRIAGLYLAGIYWKAGFEFLHVHGGVILFTLIAIAMWLFWVARIRSKLIS